MVKRGRPLDVRDLAGEKDRTAADEAATDIVTTARNQEERKGKGLGVGTVATTNREQGLFEVG